jgi:hypothetical protein
MPTHARSCCSLDQPFPSCRLAAEPAINRLRTHQLPSIEIVKLHVEPHFQFGAPMNAPHSLSGLPCISTGYSKPGAKKMLRSGERGNEARLLRETDQPIPATGRYVVHAPEPAGDCEQRIPCFGCNYGGESRLSSRRVASMPNGGRPRLLTGRGLHFGPRSRPVALQAPSGRRPPVRRWPLA